MEIFFNNQKVQLASVELGVFIFFGLLISTILGFTIGIASISKNSLILLIAKSYVTVIRQIPLLIQLLFWYFVAFLGLSNNPLKPIGMIIQLSNQGVQILGLNLSVEYSALLLGLSFFTAASISEVVRGGLSSVKIGQWEAFRSLGFNEYKGLFFYNISTVFTSNSSRAYKSIS